MSIKNLILKWSLNAWIFEKIYFNKNYNKGKNFHNLKLMPSVYNLVLTLTCRRYVLFLGSKEAGGEE